MAKRHRFGVIDAFTIHSAIQQKWTHHTGCTVCVFKESQTIYHAPISTNERNKNTIDQTAHVPKDCTTLPLCLQYSPNMFTML